MLGVGVGDGVAVGVGEGCDFVSLLEVFILAVSAQPLIRRMLVTINKFFILSPIHAPEQVRLHRYNSNRRADGNKQGLVHDFVNINGSNLCHS